MEVATGAVSWVEKAEGETVLLGCTWTVDPAPTEHLDVEWFMQMPTTNIHLATYVRGVEHVYPEYASRMRFARNVTQRDASLKIVGVQTRDYGFYTCKVKFGAFIQQVSVKLIVLVKPTQPVCVVNASSDAGLVPGALMGVLLVVAATASSSGTRLLKRKPGLHARPSQRRL
ncbi:coxsackievirus and adenovirus receptor-like, partial [Lethenteron reissneri]|uniref:coxsackievirus and adenovirus receptor-like n=1 Tax=Lethenteron reissneri TaxID=7753 RepID=UPI002AB6F76C